MLSSNVRTRGAIALVAALVLVVSGLEAVSAQALGPLPFHALLENDGSGRIFINDGSTPSWEVCKPDLTGCAPFATGNFSTGGAAPGSVFWAGGELVTPVWNGNLRATGQPSVRGTVAGNEIVTPVAGSWEGGWGTDYDSLSLSICKTASGEHCLQVNHEGPEKACGAEGATLIDPAFAGRYLRVVDYRHGSGGIFVGVGHPDYYPIVPLESSARISSAIVGRIARASGPPSFRCGPPPLFTASISSDGSAQVLCRVIRCQVVLVARSGGRTGRVKRRLPPTSDWVGKPVTLRLGPAVIRRLEGGPVLVTVKIDGRVVAHRTVTLRAGGEIGS